MSEMSEQERDMAVMAFIALAPDVHLETKLGVMGTIVADRIQALQADNARLRAALEKVGAIVDTCESNKRIGVGPYGRNGGYGSAVADIAEVIRAILDGTE